VVPVDGPHDLGGRSGYGPVPVEADQAWTAWWQQYAYSLAAVTARLAGVNGDAVRHVMERIPADEYARLGSAGRWLRVAERCAVEGGLVAEGEVLDRARRREAGLPPEAREYPEPIRTAPVVRAALPHAKRVPGEGAEPSFAPGDRVVVRDHRPEGHTRLPAYLRGRRGEVVLVNGFWVYPDSYAHSGAEAPTWVYAVRFAAADLWPGAGTHDVCADLFEPYLEADRD
jgi:nitrile hydratase